MTEVAAEHCGPTEMCVSSGEGFRERCHLSWIVKEESELPGEGSRGQCREYRGDKARALCIQFSGGLVAPEQEIHAGGVGHEAGEEGSGRESG